jgi:blue light- and temperature-responsive anti-repressor
MMRTEIAQILASARRNNARLDITGALLFNRGCFAQVLEGRQESIEGLFETISCDLRHGDITVCEIAPIEIRNFPNWSMAFAGMLEDDRATFAALTLAPSEGAETVFDLLNALVLRGETD